MSVNPPEGTLTIENSHLDVKGNVSAVALKLGTLRLTPSYGLDAVANVSNSTTHTLELSNATTGLVTTANVVVGKDLQVAGNATVSSNLTVGGTSLVDLIYPLGAIYITTSAVSPSSIWAGTTWVAYGEGRTLIGHGAGAGLTDRPTVEATGGAETHTLTKAEIPPHTHTYLGNYYDGSTDHGLEYKNTYGYTAYRVPNDTTDGVADGLQGLAHNNMQPYIVTYMWKRTA
jgi:hypothetical protein